MSTDHQPHCPAAQAWDDPDASRACTCGKPRNPWRAIVCDFLPPEALLPLPDPVVDLLVDRVAEALRNQWMAAAEVAECCLIRRDPDQDPVPYARRCIAAALRRSAASARMTM